MPRCRAAGLIQAYIKKCPEPILAQGELNPRYHLNLGDKAHTSIPLTRANGNTYSLQRCSSGATFPDSSAKPCSNRFLSQPVRNRYSSPSLPFTYDDYIRFFSVVKSACPGRTLPLYRQQTMFTGYGVSVSRERNRYAVSWSRFPGQSSHLRLNKHIIPSAHRLIFRRLNSVLRKEVFQLL